LRVLNSTVHWQTVQRAIGGAVYGHFHRLVQPATRQDTWNALSARFGGEGDKPAIRQLLTQAGTQSVNQTFEGIYRISESIAGA